MHDGGVADGGVEVSVVFVDFVDLDRGDVGADEVEVGLLDLDVHVEVLGEFLAVELVEELAGVGGVDVVLEQDV